MPDNIQRQQSIKDLFYRNVNISPLFYARKGLQRLCFAKIMPFQQCFALISSRQALNGSAGGLDLARDLSGDVCQQPPQRADHFSGAFHPEPLVDAHGLHWHHCVHVNCAGPQPGQVGGTLCPRALNKN